MSLLRVCLLLLVLPTATLAQTTTTDEEPVRHPSFSAPLPAGVVEVAGGGGAFVTSCLLCPVPLVVTQRLTLSVRWGITENVQLSLPAILTGSLDLMGGPRLSLLAGLTGIGFSSGNGVYSSFVVGAGTHFVGQRSQLAFGIVANRTFLGSSEQRRALFARAGFAFALTPDLLLGSGVGVDAYDFGPSGTQLAFTAGAGAPTGIAAPLLRWWVLSWLSADLWPWLSATTVFHDDGTVVRAVTAGANLGLTLTL